MLVFAAVVPIIPKQNSKLQEKGKKTFEALKIINSNLKKSKPNLIIISAPQTDNYSKQFEKILLGNIDSQVIKLEKINQEEISDLDLKKTKSVKVTHYNTEYESPAWHYKLGNQIISDLPKDLNIAWIAVGTLSNRLNEKSQFGYDPSAGEYDHKLIQLLSENRIEEIVYLEPDLTEAAGENGLRSYAMLFGTLANYSYQPKILSYEGSYGVGLLVAEFEKISII